MPSGDFNANAAWFTLAAITQNLLRAAGSLASLFYARARGAAVREGLIEVRHGSPAPAAAASPCTHPSIGTPKRPA